jgi:acyl-CoA reductase-like NAD-dependent aldehyde dehydrogenase
MRIVTGAEGEAMSELLVLGGERVPAADGATDQVIEPSTATSMAEVAKAGADDATRAVDIAVKAFEDGAWPRLSAREAGC